MNKKRKILTQAALVVFGAIILFHYVGWTVVSYDWSWSKVEDIGEGSLRSEEWGGNKVTILKTLGFNPSSGEREYSVKIEHPSRGWSVDKSPAIKDVRMPLFVLAVFYAGFFFIFGEHKLRG